MKNNTENTQTIEIKIDDAAVFLISFTYSNLKIDLLS